MNVLISKIGGLISKLDFVIRKVIVVLIALLSSVLIVKLYYTLDNKSLDIYIDRLRFRIKVVLKIIDICSFNGIDCASNGKFINKEINENLTRCIVNDSHYRKNVNLPSTRSFISRGADVLKSLSYDPEASTKLLAFLHKELEE